jgi:hypothetical protein
VTWDSPGGDYDRSSDHGHGPTGILDEIVLPAGLGADWVQLDATAAVRAWVEEGLPNRGLLLRPRGGQYTYHYFRSREATPANQRPRLVVTYTLGSTPPAPAAWVYLPLILKARTEPVLSPP